MDASTTLLAIAGLISGFGALLAAWSAFRRTRRESREAGRDEGAQALELCRVRAAKAEAEAERLAAEIHSLRMRDQLG